MSDNLVEVDLGEVPDFPTSIKVGHRDIVIELHPGSELDGAYGDFLDDKQRIRLAKDRMPQSIAETLIHEILHACFPSNWTLVGDVEETFVSAISPVLTQVYRDNPHLFEWLSYILWRD